MDNYLGAVVEKAGAIDISFCAISIAGALTTKAPLLDLPAAEFALPITTYTQANFLTARSAARRSAPGGVCASRRTASTMRSNSRALRAPCCMELKTDLLRSAIHKYIASQGRQDPT